MGGKGGAPAYIVPLSALFMILLTFFISLLTLANEQEYGLVGGGTGSFIHQINASGFPGILPGQRTVIDLGPGRPQFAVPSRAVEKTTGSDADVTYRRVISVEPKRLPRALTEFFRTQDKLHVPVSIRFQPGSAELTRDDKEYLRPLMMRLRSVSYYVRIEVNVSKTFVFSEAYGSAWQLSAARAGAVVRLFHNEGGMSYRRMEPIGHGSARPIVRNPADPMVNERVDIVVFKY